MIEFIYGVALNGTSVNIYRYNVIKETPKTYVLEYGSVIRKAVMQDRWYRYFINKEEAEKFLRELFEYINKFDKCIDIKYIHKELTELWVSEDISDRLKNLINYVEEFL